MKVLIVDDEGPIRELIRYNLEKENIQTVQAENAVIALNLARTILPDLIILDLMLPDMSGLDVCRILKNDQKTLKIPIIMVTAKTEDSDIVEGLNLGADDYVTKPFSPKVLIARVNSVYRRFNKNKEEDEQLNHSEIVIHNIKIYPLQHEVYVDNEKIILSATEFSLLEFLAKHKGQVFSRQQIINALKGSDYPVTERTVDVHILSIRRKIKDSGISCDNQIIETLRGVGYRMKDFYDKKEDI